MNPASPIIYQDIQSLASVIAGFKAQTRVPVSKRFSGLCGFDSGFRR